MGPIFILGSFAMAVLIVFFSARYNYLRDVELISHGINPLDRRIPNHLLRHLVLSIPGQYSLIPGIIFLALGLGFTVALAVTGQWQNSRNTSEVALSLASVLGGIGFILHWKLTVPQRERALKIQEEMLLAQKLDLVSEPDKKPED